MRRWLRRFWLRLITPSPRPVHPDVRRRLRQYAIERRLRMADYSAAWQRRWAEEARAHRTTALWRVK